MEHLVVQHYSDSNASANCDVDHVSMGIIMPTEVSLKLRDHIDVSIKHNLEVLSLLSDATNHCAQQVKVLPLELGS